MDYEEWIARERRVRIKLLETSPLHDGERIHRVCRECEEICLCHEETCPNCNGVQIAEECFEKASTGIETRIRCKFRFQSLAQDT